MNATWTQRFSTLAPMFADGGSQSLAGTGGSLGLGMLRETQATQQFTATQGQPGGRGIDFISSINLNHFIYLVAHSRSSRVLLIRYAA